MDADISRLLGNGLDLGFSSSISICFFSTAFRGGYPVRVKKKHQIWIIHLDGFDQGNIEVHILVVQDMAYSALEHLLTVFPQVCFP